LAPKSDAVGKTYPPTSYAVGREKVREFAAAVGEENPLHHDLDAAREAGYADVVAPPMFAVVFGGRAMAPALFDPEVGIDFSRMVHGGQEFTWHAPVVAGDEITTEAEFTDQAKRGDLNVFTFTSRSVNQRGELVCEGTWTNIVR
jgi:acyl dehydratase